MMKADAECMLAALFVSQLSRVETPGQIPPKNYLKLNHVLVLCSTNDEIFFYG